MDNLTKTANATIKIRHVTPAMINTISTVTVFASDYQVIVLLLTSTAVNARLAKKDTSLTKMENVN